MDVVGRPGESEVCCVACRAGSHVLCWVCMPAGKVLVFVPTLFSHAQPCKRGCACRSCRLRQLSDERSQPLPFAAIVESMHGTAHTKPEYTSTGQAIAEGHDHHTIKANGQSLTPYATPSAKITPALRQRRGTAAKSGQGVDSVDSSLPGVENASGQARQRSTATVPVALVAKQATIGAACDQHS
jgi:hypothetical protein